MLQYFLHLQSLKAKILILTKNTPFLGGLGPLVASKKQEACVLVAIYLCILFSVRSPFGVFISFRGFCDAQLKYERFPFYGRLGFNKKKKTD